MAEQKLNVTYVFVHPESIEEDEFPRSLFGQDHDPRDEFDFALASINDLRYEILVQKRQIELGENNGYDLLEPWDGILIVEEGYYEWDVLSGDYRKLKDNEVGNKVRMVEISFSEQVRDAVFDELNRRGIEFDNLGVGGGFSEEDEPVTIVHVFRYGLDNEFPFLEADVKRKGLVGFASMIADVLQKVDKKGMQ